jgi:outer membrane lipoprotein-sorting protein
MPPQRIARARIAAIALAVLAGCCVLRVVVQAGPPRDLFDEIYERGQSTDAWRTLTAAFTETSTSSLLAKPLIAKGTLAVARPDRVVMLYDEPDRRTVLIDRSSLMIVWPARGIRSTSDISASQRRVQRYFVDKTPQELRRHFTITARVAADRPGTWHLSLVPTQKRIYEGVTRIELWVDRHSLLLAAMAMTFPNGDRKLLEFSDVRINPTLEPRTFDPPP